VLTWFSSAEPKYKDVTKHGWAIYNPTTEWERMGVGKIGEAKRWRISSINRDYKHSSTYPALIGVPASMTDEDLVYAEMLIRGGVLSAHRLFWLSAVFKHRSKGRIPALSWINPKTGVSITRCSQPLVGISKKSSPADAKLVMAIRDTIGTPNAILHMLDARPKANAVANMALGGGFELVGGTTYPYCVLEFLDIGLFMVLLKFQECSNKEVCRKHPCDEKFIGSIEISS